MDTFTFKDDKPSIRPQAPPGGETHFNISDAEYGDRNIHHKYKRNNHPNNDINPPPNFVKREEVIESTPNGADPVTGKRPSIKLSAPPGGFSNLDYYAEGNSSAKTESPQSGNIQNSFPITRDDEGIGKKPPFRPVYTPQAPPGGKSSISFNYDDEPVKAPKPKPKPNPEFDQSLNNYNKPDSKSSFSFDEEQPVENKPKPKPRPNPEFQETFNEVQEPTLIRRNSNTKQNNQSTFGDSFFNSKEKDTQFKPYYTPQAPPGGKDSISLAFNGDATEIDVPHTGKRRNYENDHFNESNDPKYKPAYTPQAPPGGKDSISLAFSDSTPETNKVRTGRRNYENDHFNESNSDTAFKPAYAPQAPPGGKDSISLAFDGSSSEINAPRTGKRRNYDNDHFRGSSDLINGNEDQDKNYKPYYAPQAPPGGKDSISLGFGGSSSNENDTPHTGRRRNYNNDHFRGSSDLLNANENNDETYKPYYAPQAPPGGKDSISLGESNNSLDNNSNSSTPSFSGRRRNYHADHFKSSFGFNY